MTFAVVPERSARRVLASADPSNRMRPLPAEPETGGLNWCVTAPATGRTRGKVVPKSFDYASIGRVLSELLKWPDGHKVILPGSIPPAAE